MVVKLIILLIFFKVICGENDFDDETCGKRKNDVTELIVAGFDAKAGDWPWHAALYHKEDGGFEYKCGGTLVHKYLIVTAAHCVFKRKPENLLVKLGAYNLGENEEQNAEDYNVSDVVVHERYNRNTFENDIAILKLTVPVIETIYISPACLWKRDDGIFLNGNIVDKAGTVIGWGLNDAYKRADVLQQATMQVVNSFACLKSNKLFFGQFISDRIFCAGYKNGTTVCNGDSGGGMFFESNGQWYLRGIVSFSKEEKGTARCYLKEYAGFTDAAQYIDWIYQNAPVNKNEDPILGHPNLRLINQINCGYNNYPLGYNESAKRVIGQYPWMVTLRHPFGDPTYVGCTGALINKDYVLSIDCTDVVASNPEVLATFGEYNTYETKDCEMYNGSSWCNSPIQSVNVASVAQKDSLTLLRLASPAFIGRREHIRAICLPTSKEARGTIWSNYTVTGWMEALRAKTLQRVVARIYSLDKCRNTYKNSEYRSLKWNHPNHTICIRNIPFPKRVPQCNDYLHGTIIQHIGEVNNNNNSYILAGFLTRQGYCVVPDLYLNVAYYIEWILDNIKP